MDSIVFFEGSTAQLCAGMDVAFRRRGWSSTHIASGLAMALQGTSHSAAPRIECAPILVDFDWKLKYAVASGTISAVNKPLLRLELYVSKPLSKVEEAGLGSVLSENQILKPINEFTKAQLDTLLGAMGAIEQGLGEADSAL